MPLWTGKFTFRRAHDAGGGALSRRAPVPDGVKWLYGRVGEPADVPL